ncbi:MAG: hypothetical protein AB8G14_07460 [Ilumatobacter sp.]
MTKRSGDDDAPSDSPSDHPSDSSGAATTWTGHTTGKALWIPAIPMIVFGVGAALLARPWLAGIMFGAALSAAAVARITTMIDHRGVTVQYSVLRWPRTNVALREIVGCETTDISPWKWGGWGYRGSRAAIGRAAVIVRGGPGVKILTAKDTLSISVDDPSEAVTVLRALLAENDRNLDTDDA